MIGKPQARREREILLTEYVVATGNRGSPHAARLREVGIIPYSTGRRREQETDCIAAENSQQTAPLCLQVDHSHSSGAQPQIALKSLSSYLPRPRPGLPGGYGKFGGSEPALALFPTDRGGVPEEHIIVDGQKRLAWHGSRSSFPSNHIPGLCTQSVNVRTDTVGKLRPKRFFRPAGLRPPCGKERGFRIVGFSALGRKHPAKSDCVGLAQTGDDAP